MFYFDKNHIKLSFFQLVFIFAAVHCLGASYSGIAHTTTRMVLWRDSERSANYNH